MPIGPGVACCGTAAFTGQQVVATDIETDAAWEPYRAMALAHGLKACWSTPISSSTRVMLGTLALYHPHARPPNLADHGVMELLIDTAALLIERDFEAAERVAAVNALRENERRYRELIKAFPAAVYTTDAAGRVTLYNDAAVSLWGEEPDLGPDSPAPAHRMLRPHGAPLPNDRAPLAAAFPPGASRTGVEAIIERPDGERRNVLVYPHRTFDGAGRIDGGINILLDITERKRVEEALRWSEAFARGVIAATPDCVKILALDGQFVWVSDQGPRLLEVESFEISAAPPGSISGSTSETGPPPSKRSRRRSKVKSDGSRAPVPPDSVTRASGTSRSPPSRARTGGPTGSWSSPATSPPGRRPKRRSAPPTGGRTSFSPPWPTSSVTRWHRSGTGSRSCG
jgi:PAS domain-containing protein